ncbi:hypothetical protein DL98DRAFT_530430 [Cadophora sp. DSE1049]|nr:hypothetical protein DL98DRAFT_530430 [Cadophora sp. DSE1049]
MPLKHSTHFDLPHDVEPRRSSIELSNLTTSTSPSPSGRRVKIRTFKLFNKLPLELKRMVWEECSMIPRCIKFDVYGRTGCELPGWCLNDWQLFHYTLSFSEFLLSGPLYFNFAVDSIYFPSSLSAQRALYPIDHSCQCFLSRPTIFEFEMFQKLKHHIIGEWTPLKPNEMPTMCLDLFEGLETFTCGWDSYETFLWREPRENTYGIFLGGDGEEAGD